MQLDEFWNYKNQLMGDILSSPEIVSLIDENISINDAGKLAYTKVFPCEYIPETVEHGDTYVCFDVDIIAVPNKTYLLPVLYVWVFTHRSKLRLPNGGGVLTDKMCSLICGAINGSKEYGLGELKLSGVKRFAPMSDFQGKVMTFNAKDFNRVHNPKTYVPSNRRTGGE